MAAGIRGQICIQRRRKRRVSGGGAKATTERPARPVEISEIWRVPGGPNLPRESAGKAAEKAEGARARRLRTPTDQAKNLGPSNLEAYPGGG